jgi:hypothetical protein
VRLRLDHRPAAGGGIESAVHAPEAGKGGHKKAPRREAGGLSLVQIESLGALLPAAAVRRGAALAFSGTGLKALEARTGPLTLRSCVHILSLSHRKFSLPLV